MNIFDKLHTSVLYCFTADRFIKGREHLKIVEQLCIGGADIIQLREKSMSDRNKLEFAKQIRNITYKHNVLFIVNDDIIIAKLSDADGVHLGQDDIPVKYAKQFLPDKIIGNSNHNLVQYKESQNFNIDYTAIGPIFNTDTKLNNDPEIGITELKKILKHKKKFTVGIGGIKRENINQVKESGIACIAIVTAIINSNDIIKTTQDFKKIIE